MQELKINKKNAVNAYNQATPKQRKMLEDLFGEENLKLDIAEVATSYKAACKLQGIKPLTISNFDFLPEEDREAQFANHQSDVIIRALNEGWVPDYSNGNELKWVIYCKWTGSGFSLHVVGDAFTASLVGARRSFVSERIARFFAKQFGEMYCKTLIIK